MVGIMEKVLCLIHGFGCDSSSMNSIKRLFEEGEGKGTYDRIISVDLYDGNRGFDFSGTHNVATPIMQDENYYDMNDEKYPSLTTKFKKDLENALNDEGEIDFITHSTGGLVLRAYLKYCCDKSTAHSNRGYYIKGKYKVSKAVLLGVPNHGTILANRWFSRFGNTVVNLIFRVIYGIKEAVENVEGEIPDLSEGEINQLRVGSEFLKKLNQGLETLPYIDWYTIRGERNRWYIGNFLFSYWLFGLIPTFWPERSNDEVVQSKSVPLEGAINLKNRWLDHGALHDLDMEHSLKRVTSPKKKEKVKQAIIWLRNELVKIMTTC